MKGLILLMNSASDVWSRVLDILRGELTSTAISTWFDDCQVVEISDNRLVIYSPSNFKRDVIAGRFSDPIKAALRDIFSGDFDLVVLGEGELDPYVSRSQEAPPYADSRYTFARFVVGNSNRFAHAAAKAVAEKLTAADYNPLFIYGDSGLGKTHLLYAIAHEIHVNRPDYSIIYVKSEEFTNELISAIQTGKNKMVDFREKYRYADLFLMDDVQFIAGKIQTEEEFFNTFNTLRDAGKQIVLTSDRPPMDILRLSTRLRSRFESGLLADVQPPDYETRIAIIRNKAQQTGVVLPDEVVNYIAENITENIRQIEGTVKKVVAYSNILDDNISVNSVARAIKDLFREKTEFLPTPDIIIEETAHYYNLSPNDLKGQRRTRNTAMARHISMYLIRKITNLSLDDIGEEYQGRHHTTVLASIRLVEEEIKRDSSLADTVKDIMSNINSRS